MSEGCTSELRTEPEDKEHSSTEDIALALLSLHNIHTQVQGERLHAKNGSFESIIYK